MSAERSMTLADSIMADTTFVLRGVMSKKWNGVIKFAVSDPIKTSHMSCVPPETDGLK